MNFKALTIKTKLGRSNLLFLNMEQLKIVESGYLPIKVMIDEAMNLLSRINSKILSLL